MADEEGRGRADALFEDLDKFFASIDESEWPDVEPVEDEPAPEPAPEPEARQSVEAAEELPPAEGPPAMAKGLPGPPPVPEEEPPIEAPAMASDDEGGGIPDLRG